MIPPDTNLEPDARVSLPVGLLNQVVAVLGELPAKQSMDLILAVREHAEVVVVQDLEEAFTAVANGGASL